MGPSSAVLSLAIIALSNVLLVVGAPASSTIADKSSKVQVDGESVDSSSFHIVSTIWNNGNKKGSHKVKVVGRGVEDSFDLPLGENNQLTSLQSKEYALYENPNKGLSFFTDTPSSLVVMNNGKCTKRSYETSKGKTTYSESSMKKKECDSVKEKMKVTKDKWQKEFDEKMRKQFPPCFPFCGEKASSQEKDASEPTDSSSEEMTETDKTSPEYWRQWEKKFQAQMRKKFPPCFPFCDKEPPIKPDQDNKKNKKPIKPSGKGSSAPKKGSEETTQEDTDENNWNF